MKNDIYTDIETIPDQSAGALAAMAGNISPPGNMSKPETIAKWEAEKKPALIEEAWRKTSFKADQGEVICAAWAFNDNEPQSVSRTLGESEADMLQEMFERIAFEVKGAHRPPTFIGHHVLGFDLRFLWQRAIILGVKPVIYLPVNARSGDDRVFDTMIEWAGYRDTVSLDRLCRALEIDTKGTELGGEDIDGSKVWDFVKAGRVDDVVTYCKADVERVRQVHRRMTFATPLPQLQAA